MACGLLGLRSARAGAEPSGPAIALPARTGTAGPEEPAWLAVLSFSAGVPLGSAQERVLELDGYSGVRYSFGGSVVARVAEQLGLGAFAAYTTRSSGARFGGPDLGESTGTGGGQLSWLVGGRARHYLFVSSARLGAGYGATGFHSVSAGHWGLAWGGQLALLYPSANFGAALGFLSLQVPGSGALGRDNNLGSAYGSLELLFDG